MPGDTSAHPTNSSANNTAGPFLKKSRPVRRSEPRPAIKFHWRFHQTTCVTRILAKRPRPPKPRPWELGSRIRGLRWTGGQQAGSTGLMESTDSAGGGVPRDWTSRDSSVGTRGDSNVTVNGSVRVGQVMESIRIAVVLIPFS